MQELKQFFFTIHRDFVVSLANPGGCMSFNFDSITLALSVLAWLLLLFIVLLVIALVYFEQTQTPDKAICQPDGFCARKTTPARNFWKGSKQPMLQRS